MISNRLGGPQLHQGQVRDHVHVDRAFSLLGPRGMAPLRKTSRVFDSLANQGRQIVTYAADRAAVKVVPLRSVNTHRRFCHAEAPARQIWEQRIKLFHGAKLPQRVA
jgi:hypothetical protein